jgi:two-component system NtrC family sensor kinase
MWSSLYKIRYRLILGFLACFLGVVVFVGLSYRYFIRLEKKLVFLNRADEVLNVILEVRRYEKNYFLYHQEEDYQQALGYLNQLEDLLRVEAPQIIMTMGDRPWEQLQDRMGEYRRSFSGVHDVLSNPNAIPDEGASLQEKIKRIRAAGQSIIEYAGRLARVERESIQNLLHRYRYLFIIFFVCSIGIGATIVYFLEAKVVKPLHTIEEGTRTVAQGNFQPIPPVATRDEIGSLVQAFNRMVRQLQDTREQMIQTEKLTSLGTLTSGVAHQLNNPLSNISTSCQILLEEIGDRVEGYHKELLSSIEEQVVKARDTVRALLEFSRESAFELKRVDLRIMVEDTLKLTKGEIPTHVEVRMEVPAGIEVKLDMARIEQALLNLLMNGIQAMQGEGVLTIRGSVDRGRREALLEVIDTGVGIDPENVPRIFDPFFTTKDIGKGTGLGLSVAYGIIERHGGRISVSSEVGRGSTFTIALPLNG